MNRIRNRWSAGLLAAALSVFTAVGGDGGKIPWETDYQKGQAEARKDGKPMMLYFTMDG